MSLKTQISNQPQTCQQCQREAIPGTDFCSPRCEQLDLAPKAKAFCLAEKISVRDLVRISGGKFQRDTWHRFLNGQLGDALWQQVEAIFFKSLIQTFQSLGLKDGQIDRKLSVLL